MASLRPDGVVTTSNFSLWQQLQRLTSPWWSLPTLFFLLLCLTVSHLWEHTWKKLMLIHLHSLCACKSQSDWPEEFGFSVNGVFPHGDISQTAISLHRMVY